MSNLWYTSDPHVGHRLVSGLRGFDDPADHDAWLADLWDSSVQSGDQVFVLGDLSINGGQHALDWIESRPGTKHLIAGNHDPVHPRHYRKYPKSFRHWLNYFETIQPFYRKKLLGRTVLMSHFPYFGEGDRLQEDRHPEYRLRDEGELLLHGHTHDKQKAHDGNMFHVGLDAWRELVPQETILDWISSTS